MASRCLGIIVGGGPAPGINAVIGAASINAINHGMRVYGFYEGFKHLTSEEFDVDTHSTELRIPDVARIHFDGGSILRTARTSLLDKSAMGEHDHVTPDAKKVQTVLNNLAKRGITHLVTIGGDDTALSSRFVSEGSQGKIRVVHVPKTIDNDLPLPGDTPTFGYNTARHYGAQIVANLMEDSRTTLRWYLVVAMGRNAGHLALGIGKAAAATLTLIPEEFPDRTSVSDIVDVIEGAILKRRAMGREDGVVVLAEGLAYKLGDVDELELILGKKVPLDGAGHPRLSEVPLDEILKLEILKRFKHRDDTATVVGVDLGYELRCAAPTPFDMAYCRDLGHGAVTILTDESLPAKGMMVSIQQNDLRPIKFDDIVDPKTNRTAVKMVDLNATAYQVARSYMIRLEQGDFDSPRSLEALAKQAKMTPEEFNKHYRHVVEESVVKLPPSLARAQVVQVQDDPIASHRGKTTQVLPM